MAAKTYQQEFQGYWRDINKVYIPAASGVYCVYECRHNQDNTVSLLKLIYIGESGNVNGRIAGHEKKDDWKKHVGWGNELCYNFTPVGSTDRNRVEAAYIYEHKPLENTEYKHNFPFDTTTVSTSGMAAFLKPFFTVYSSVGASVLWPHR